VTYYSNFPVGFLITAFAFGSYLLVRLATARRSARTPPGSESRGDPPILMNSR
jgi:hypothetical protein